ncbi:MAG: hypothetical protein INR71_09410 [Terriglobus roseus]|nr:hypothetical protein [Terriglobus roseus]
MIAALDARFARVASVAFQLFDPARRAGERLSVAFTDLVAAAIVLLAVEIGAEFVG